MNFEKKDVEITTIDTKDNTYKITTQKCIKSLVNSIKLTGLINLPILIKNDTGFSVISGFRRIEACKRLGWLNIRSRIVSPDTDLKDCINIAIAGNSMERELNLIELSISFNMLSRVYNDSELIHIALSLGLPDNLSYIKKVKKICSFSEPVQQGILSDSISIPIALELAKLPDQAGDYFALLFNRLKQSLNKQREILTFAKEIAIRDDMSLSDFIQNSIINEILTRDDLDQRQKTQKIRCYLRDKRFPLLSQAENQFNKLVKELGLGNGMQIIPPPDFEGTNYKINLCFRNMEELESQKNRLNSIITNPALKNILT